MQRACSTAAKPGSLCQQQGTMARTKEVKKGGKAPTPVQKRCGGSADELLSAMRTVHCVPAALLTRPTCPTMTTGSGRSRHQPRRSPSSAPARCAFCQPPLPLPLPASTAAALLLLLQHVITIAMRAAD